MPFRIVRPLKLRALGGRAVEAGPAVSSVVLLGLGGVLTGGCAVTAATAAMQRAVPLQGELAIAIKINEVMYDPPVAGAETDAEWIELYNAGGESALLSGWKLGDNRAERAIPPLELPAGGFAIIAGGPGFLVQYPEFAGLLVELDGPIGNGLGNAGDQVKLFDSTGALVDGMSYGADAAVLDPPVASVDTGHSVERVPAGLDTDKASDWVAQALPSPGESAFAIPTATATLTSPDPPPTANTQPSVPIRLNEFLPAPRDVDWNGDGVVDSGDEWVEIFNRSDVEWNLSGWQLDDIAGGGSTPWTAPEGTVVPSRGYLLLFGSVTRIALNNAGDEVRLVSPAGDVADSVTYRSVGPDASIGRVPDGEGPWIDTTLPTPGEANSDHVILTVTPPPEDTATPGARPTAEPGMTPAAYFPLLITEVMYDGQGPGADADGEWVEVHNPGSAAVSLSGWSLHDGNAMDDLPGIDVPPGGFVVIAAGPMEGAQTIADGRIGNGLANTGDVVRLVNPAGEEADAVSYGRNLTAFDPSVPLAPPGASIERIPSGQDTDSANDWWSQDLPSPGGAGSLPDPVPRVVINEVMPSPRHRDWDGDGQAGYEDEWIELHNGGSRGVRLVGWALVVGDGRWSAELPASVIAAGGYVVLWRRDTSLFMEDVDTLELVRGDGVVADRVEWSRSPGFDRVWGRPEGGADGWTDGLTPTPGMANAAIVAAAAGESAPEVPREIAPLSALSGVRQGERIAVRGAVTVRSGVMGRRVFYLGDATGGVRVLVSGSGPEPDLALGDVVRIVGRYGWSLGEPVVRASERDLTRESAGTVPEPIPVRTGDLEAAVGRLAVLAGRVDGWEATAVFIDDGSGPARVLFRTQAGVRRPWVERTEWLRAVGIVGRFAREPESPGGYRLIPRGPEDVANPAALPVRLPAAGRAVPDAAGIVDRDTRFRPRANRPRPHWRN